MLGGKGVILKYIDRPEAKTYLNIGSGSDKTARFLIDRDKKVTDIDIKRTHSFKHENYSFIEWNLELGIPVGGFDVIIANHVLEHIRNTGIFLLGCNSALNDDGVLCIAVPPFKHALAGGHVHVFNMGILMYNLVLTGFNVVDGHFKKEGYNIIGIVKPRHDKLPKLNYDKGDIDILVRNGLLPSFFRQGMNGDMKMYNWII